MPPCRHAGFDIADTPDAYAVTHYAIRAFLMLTLRGHAAFCHVYSDIDACCRRYYAMPQHAAAIRGAPHCFAACRARLLLLFMPPLPAFTMRHAVTLIRATMLPPMPPLIFAITPFIFACRRFSRAAASCLMRFDVDTAAAAAMPPY